MTSKRQSAYLISAAAMVLGSLGHAACQIETVPPGDQNPADGGNTGEGGNGEAGTPTTSSSMGGSGGVSDGGNMGGSTTGGDGGAGGMEPPMTGTDQCAGERVNIDHGFIATLMGNTALGMDDYSSACEASSGPDMVYEVVVAQPGTLSINVSAPGGQDISLYMRQFCDNENTVLWCRNHDQMQMTRNFTTAVAPGTYYLFVDTDGDTGGEYNLSMAFDQGTCGDGAVNAGEACDDGNALADDGCDANCDLEAGSNDSCADPQGPILLSEGRRLFTGVTSGNTASHSFDSSECGVTDSGGAKERVYSFTPQISGQLTMSLGYDETGAGPSICEADINATGCWDRVLHVRHADGDASTAACQNVQNQVACANGGVDPSYAQDLVIDVIANETYYVFVDSYWDGGPNPGWASGPYYLHLDLAPPAN